MNLPGINIDSFSIASFRTIEVSHVLEESCYKIIETSKKWYKFWL